ncbi:MAG: helix-turn-helix transcriptional regulator [Planctomycetes bacterium]|nr:helix-turn-helix transcriptional regulator [Planctomycetota bacterium]
MRGTAIVRPPRLRDRRRSEGAIKILDSWFMPGVSDPAGAIEQCLTRPAHVSPIIRRGRVRVIRSAGKGQAPAYAISQRIRELRLIRGFRQQDLAGKSGIARSNIARLERGTHLPSMATLRRLAKALDVSMAQIVERPRTTGADEERVMAEAGLAGWSSLLQKEDRR